MLHGGRRKAAEKGASQYPGRRNEKNGNDLLKPANRNNPFCVTVGGLRSSTSPEFAAPFLDRRIHCERQVTNEPGQMASPNRTAMPTFCLG